jgi:hypothetical protein
MNRTDKKASGPKAAGKGRKDLMAERQHDAKTSTTGL